MTLLCSLMVALCAGLAFGGSFYLAWRRWTPPHVVPPHTAAFARFYVEYKPGRVYGYESVPGWYHVIDRFTGRTVDCDVFLEFTVADAQAKLYNRGTAPIDYTPRLRQHAELKQRVRAQRDAAPWMLMVLALSLSQYAPYLTLGAGQAADWFSSYRFTQTRRCYEANPRYQDAEQRFTPAKAARDKVLSVAAGSAFVWVTGRSHSRVIRWIGRSVAYGSGINGGISATRNVALCGV